MLTAMTTGHEGSLSTLHASSPADAIRRLQTLALMGDVDLPYRAVADQVASALDLVVHQSRLPDGRRRVVELAVGRGRTADGPLPHRTLAGRAAGEASPRSAGRRAPGRTGPRADAGGAEHERGSPRPCAGASARPSSLGAADGPAPRGGARPRARRGPPGSARPQPARAPARRAPRAGRASPSAPTLRGRSSAPARAAAGPWASLRPAHAARRPAGAAAVAGARGRVLRSADRRHLARRRGPASRRRAAARRGARRRAVAAPGARAGGPRRAGAGRGASSRGASASWQLGGRLDEVARRRSPRAARTRTADHGDRDPGAAAHRREPRPRARAALRAARGARPARARAAGRHRAGAHDRMARGGAAGGGRRADRAASPGNAGHGISAQGPGPALLAASTTLYAVGVLLDPARRPAGVVTAAAPSCLLAARRVFAAAAWGAPGARPPRRGGLGDRPAAAVRAGRAGAVAGRRRRPRSRPGDGARHRARRPGRFPVGEALARARASGVWPALLAGAAVAIGCARLPRSWCRCWRRGRLGARPLAAGRARGRARRALMRELPDLLDLLAICVESGMALDPALAARGRAPGRRARRGGRAGAARPLAGDTPRRGLPGSRRAGGLPELARTVGRPAPGGGARRAAVAGAQGQAESLRARAPAGGPRARGAGGAEDPAGRGDADGPGDPAAGDRRPGRSRWRARWGRWSDDALGTGRAPRSSSTWAWSSRWAR